jgi:nucleoside-diphosphate-sugar epimerase
MHVLVTGGAGYIGSTLVPVLLAAGHECTVVDRFFFGEEALAAARRGAGERLRLVRADVRRVDPRLFEGVDALVDLAGMSNDPSCDLDPELTRSVNLEGAVRVARLAQAAGAARLVFVSSCSVYGQGAHPELTEEAPLRPVSLYARAKADAEDRILQLGGTTGVTATVLRLATAFGLSGRMRFDLAVNVMTRNAWVDRQIIVEGGGRQWRPFVHVHDVADTILAVLTAPPSRVAGEVFNVGSDANNVRIVNLAYRVRELVPGSAVTVAGSDPDRRDYHVAFGKLARVLGVTPGRRIEDGVVEILGALRAGTVDPDDRRGYTLRQYAFLAEVERTWNAVAIDGRVLA